MNGILRAQAQRAVENGAAYLDDEAALQYTDIVPRHWHRVIDLNRLDVERTTQCVLAQLGQASRHNFLYYGTVAHALGMEPTPDSHDCEVISRGFRAVPDEPAHMHEHYRELTLAWKWLILKRRAKEPALTLVALAS